MRKTVWVCDTCHVSVTLYVTPSEPPTHVCRKAVNKTKQLTKKEGETQ